MKYYKLKHPNVLVSFMLFLGMLLLTTSVSFMIFSELSSFSIVNLLGMCICIMILFFATIFVLCVTIYFYKHIDTDTNSYLKRLSPEVKAKWLAKSNSNCEKDVNYDQD